MVIVFRVDASIEIGNGHVLRCLTLAESFRSKGNNCHFVCRKHKGNLISLIKQHGFEVTTLKNYEIINKKSNERKDSNNEYLEWLGCNWELDAEQTSIILGKLKPHLLIVDHYAIDKKWEMKVKKKCEKIIIIDDLANRKHHCDILIDQNFGRLQTDYDKKVSKNTKKLIGPDYAILRNEFIKKREFSIKRREKPEIKKILISMGGVDKENATCMVMESLKYSNLPLDCKITIIMGPKAPWVQKVKKQVQLLPWKTRIIINTNEMAKHIAESDFVIGAAGTSSWERCCLGVPSIVVILAENQACSANALKNSKAAILIGLINEIEIKLPQAINKIMNKNLLIKMSKASAVITDGLGVEKILDEIKIK
jgi:UDP-2,4-diacetamido-2,4,6-trideoxy-beta-L-altropyranose hydrolase